MRFAFALICSLIVLSFWSDVSAETSSSPYAFPLKRDELLDLARELAPRVDLFREVWAIDPKAEFYAGTTRDYLYWILGHFRGLRTPKEIAAQKEALLSRKQIKFNEMVSALSDADIMTRDPDKFHDLQAEDFGIRKLDSISFDRINPKHKMGQTELKQGYIALEKIRLSKKGVVEDQTFGDGVEELISGKISIHFAIDDEFWETHYAKEGVNHPILLAVRYLRIVAQDYLQRHGSGYPDREKLFSAMSPEVRQHIQTIIQAAQSDPKFKAFIKNSQGLKWLNGSIQKSFRSFTNATAAFELMKEMGVTDLIDVYSPKIESILDYLLKVKRDSRAIRQAFSKYETSAKEIYQPIAAYLTDNELVHGAGSEEAFRSLIFQGVIPSEEGLAGRGLYGVAIEDLKFAKKWSESKADTDDIVVALKLSPTTKIIDITQGSGKKLFDAWNAKNPRNFDRFAEAFGADLIVYEFPMAGLKKKHAFVLKNSDVIAGRRGVLKNPRPLKELVTEFEKLRSAWNQPTGGELAIAFPILRDFLITPLLKGERDYLKDLLPPSLVQKTFLKTNRPQVLKGLGQLAYHWPSSFLKGIFKKHAWSLLADLMQKGRQDLKLGAIDILESQPTWPDLIWQQVRRLLADPDSSVRYHMVIALPDDTSLPPEIWTLIPGLLRDPDPDVRNEMAMLLPFLQPWTKQFWKQVPSFMNDSDPSIRAMIAEALQSQKKWPKAVRGLAPTLLRDPHSLVQAKMLHTLLNNGKSLTGEVWRTLPTVMKKADSYLLNEGSVLEFLNHHLAWPKTFWNEVPALLSSPNALLKVLVIDALRSQKKWTQEVWNLVPSLLNDKSSEVKSMMARALQSRKKLPQKVWDVIPNVLSEAYSDPHSDLFLAIRSQEAWPRSFWDKVPTLLQSTEPNTRNGMAYATENQKRIPKGCLDLLKTMHVPRMKTI